MCTKLRSEFLMNIGYRVQIPQKSITLFNFKNIHGWELLYPYEFDAVHSPKWLRFILQILSVGGKFSKSQLTEFPGGWIVAFSYAMCRWYIIPSKSKNKNHTLNTRFSGLYHPLYEPDLLFPWFTFGLFTNLFIKNYNMYNVHCIQ